MATIQGVYVALFGRPADPTGLAYFNGVTKNGADLTKIGDLASTQEYKDRFAGQNNVQIVTSIYQSLYNRAPEAAGLNFFVDALNKGTLSINNIAIAILDGAQGSDKTIVNNKIAAADAFTKALDTAIEIGSYSGNTAAAAGIAFLKPINESPNSIPNTAAVDAAILNIVNTTGGTSPVPGVTIQLTASADLVANNVANPTFKSTAGDDTILAGHDGTNYTINAGDSIDAGLGADTLKITVSAADLVSVEPTSIKGVETVVLTSAGAFSGAVSLKNADSALKLVTLNAATAGETVAVTNLAKTAVAEVSGANKGTADFGFLDATTGTSDAATLKLTNVDASGTGVVKVSGIETLTVDLNGSSTIKTFTDAEAISVKVTGAGSLTVTDPFADAALKAFDASASTGNIKLALNGGDTVYTGSKGIDGITLAGGKETIVYNSGNLSTLNKMDTYTGFATGSDKIEVKTIDFGSAGKAAFTTITTDPTTSVNAFFGGNAAAYNAGTGMLYFDSNKDGNFNADTDLVIKVAGVNVSDIAWS